jgi:hypothetical protein
MVCAWKSNIFGNFLVLDLNPNEKKNTFSKSVYYESSVDDERLIVIFPNFLWHDIWLTHWKSHYLFSMKVANGFWNYIYSRWIFHRELTMSWLQMKNSSILNFKLSSGFKYFFYGCTHPWILLLFFNTNYSNQSTDKHTLFNSSLPI